VQILDYINNGNLIGFNQKYSIYRAKIIYWCSFDCNGIFWP